MLAHALEFAPGTAEDCKKIVLGLMGPKQLLHAYWQAKRQHGTTDIVLICLNMDPGELYSGPRQSMVEHLRRFKFPGRLDPAHSVVQLPRDSDAFWLVVPVPKTDLPVMCVLYAVPYEEVPEGQELTGGAG